jgi:phosphoenolpyruvate---glycerone phosphotransferase subunit DhaL
MNGSFLDAIGAVTEAIENNKEFLTDLDREIGDADHGINMSRGFRSAMAKLKAEPVDDLSSGLKKTAMTLLSTVGGASGPLYGTAFLRGAKAAEGKTTIDKELAAQILRAAIDGIEERGKAVPGDKTMIDALEPAYDAFSNRMKEEKPFLDCLKAACDAAGKGVEYTKTISARKGRASYLGERSIGHQDPGATSVVIILRALTEYYQKLS